MPGKQRRQNLCGKGHDEQTKMPRFMLEAPRRCTIFCFALIHYIRSNYVTNTFLLVSSSIRSKQLLYVALSTVKAKKENKNIQQRTLSSFITISLN